MKPLPGRAGGSRPRREPGPPCPQTPVTNAMNGPPSAQRRVERRGRAAPAPTAEQLLLECAPRLYRRARQLLDNEEEAEEVAAQVLLGAVRWRGTGRGGAALAARLDRALARAALALQRKHAPRAEPAPPCPDRSELAGMLQAAATGLPAWDREVFVLADVEGLSDAEVGQRLGLSREAVRSRLYRARLLVRRALGGPRA